MNAPTGSWVAGRPVDIDKIAMSLWVFGAGALVLFPSLIYLFRVFKAAPR